MRALRRFTVRTRLPEPLAPLAELVNNLRWSWHPETLDLFEAIDAAAWARCHGDPVRFLGEVSKERLAELASDQAFLGQLEAAHANLRDYLGQQRWYQSLDAAPPAVAYFSPEFGITEVLPQYSGGLGILAGDHLKAASDLGVPIIGVGLFYRSGYFVQSLSRDGWQLERYPGLDPQGLPVSLLQTAEGQPAKVAVGLPGGRVMTAQVWLAQVGRVPLLLLDTDVEDNAPEERQVTDRLYGGTAEHRLLQEMLLGIGGVRAIRAYCAATGHAAPEVFHTNEGHAGFLGLERIRELVAEGLAFDEAIEAVRAGTVFTTHTPVPAGIDRFPRDLVAAYFGGDNAAEGVPVERILELGSEPDASIFNMAHMGLRLAGRANGVSKLHGIVSREMFASLWPGFDTDEVPITSVTNGVHAPTWVAREIFDIAESVDPDLVTQARGFESIAGVDDDTIWSTRRVLREKLVHEVRRRLRVSLRERGVTSAEMGWVDSAFDPDVLTIGFARRVPSYKRLTLMLRDRARLTQLLLDPDRPIQMVIAGKAHPADDGGKHLIQQIVQFADSEDVRHRIAFLPDYDIGMARYLYAGCDVWLNNPLRPLEACGTSGMKSALNGGLNLSIRDGWWDELYDGENGWAIPTADGVEDPDRRDDIESAALYELIEKSVRVLFYDGAPPKRWVAMVRHTLGTLGPEVLASRMVRDYVQTLYRPAARAAGQMREAGFTPARDFASWRAHLESAWPKVRVTHVETTGESDIPSLGETLHVRTEVELGELTADDVDVQVAFGPVDSGDNLRSTTAQSLQLVDAADGIGRFEGTLVLDRAGSFGYTVRVLPRHPALANPAALGLVTAAEPTESPTRL